MTSYKIKINHLALLDIQNATNWYNQRLPGLGSRFQRVIKQHINSLKLNHYLFSIRYSEVHCMPVKKFPFMIHFLIDDLNKAIEIYGVIHTGRNPEIWYQRYNDV